MTDDAGDAWPVDLGERGIAESVVTTRNADGRWDVAALGVHAGDPVTARTYGETRTRRNFRTRGGGYVQFTRDPLTFVAAALEAETVDDPILDAADAWARVTIERRDVGDEGGTSVATWTLRPVDSAVECRTVPTTNRGYYAVVEATVAASRLGVDAYDRETLLDRLAYFESVVERCGGERERAAFDRVRDIVDVDWNR